MTKHVQKNRPCPTAQPWQQQEKDILVIAIVDTKRLEMTYSIIIDVFHHRRS